MRQCLWCCHHDTYVIFIAYPVHLMNVQQCQVAAIRPNQLTWTVSPPVGVYCLHPFIITQPES